MAHFKDNLLENDLIYGMGETIHLYIYNYYYTWPSRMRTAKSLRPDQWDQAHAKYGKNVINKYNENMSTKMFSVAEVDEVTGVSVDLSKKDTKADPAKIFQDYFAALEKNVALGPGSLQGDLDRIKSGLLKGRSDAASLSTSRELGAVMNELAIRRSCKFGIQYFTETRNVRVHYLLDKMDPSTIVTKKTLHKVVRGKNRAIVAEFDKVPICTSELRFIFRNWQRIKSGGKMLFYLSFNTCLAPWENTAKAWKDQWGLWAEYAKQRVDKYRDPNDIRGKAPTQLAKFDEAWAKYETSQSPEDAGLVIAAFAAIPSGFVNGNEPPPLVTTVEVNTVASTAPMSATIPPTSAPKKSWASVVSSK